MASRQADTHTGKYEGRLESVGWQAVRQADMQAGRHVTFNSRCKFKIAT